MSSDRPRIVKMEVDNPLSLKRSSSAPMINEINSVPQTSYRDTSSLGGCAARPRRFSTSFSPVLGGPSSPKLTARVNQLRREESVDLLGREAAHERELHSTMVISQSWEDLTLVQDSKSDSESSQNSGSSGSKHMFVSLCGGQSSPTRSPALMRPSPSIFKPAAISSPSPTRKFVVRRSQSPIAMRPSPLGSVKRKFELDEPEPSAKRGGGLLIAQPKLDLGGSCTMVMLRGGCEGLTRLQPLASSSPVTSQPMVTSPLISEPMVSSTPSEQPMMALSLSNQPMVTSSSLSIDHTQPMVTSSSLSVDHPQLMVTSTTTSEDQPMVTGDDHTMVTSSSQMNDTLKPPTSD